jgi:hypothetical protein
MIAHNKNAFRPILIYLVLSLVFFLLQLISVSLVSFFHFQLNHPLAIIEDWISNNSWFIFTTLKIFVMWLFLKFYVSYNDYPSERRQFLNFVLGKTNPTAFLIIFYYWAFYFTISSMQFMGEANFQIWAFIKAYFSTGLLFVSIAVIGSLLIQNYSNEKTIYQLAYLLLFVALEYFLISYTFIYIVNLNLFLIFGLLAMVPLLVWNSLKLMNVFWVILLGLTPLAVLSGQALFLDAKSQVFAIKEPMSIHLHLTFLSILLTYLIIKDSKRVFFPPKTNRYSPDQSI